MACGCEQTQQTTASPVTRSFRDFDPDNGGPVTGISRTLASWYQSLIELVNSDPILGASVTGITTALALRVFNSLVPEGSLV